MESRSARPRASFGPWSGPPGPVEADRRPIDLYPRVGDDRWSDVDLNRATWAFVALGVVIRVFRLLLDHPLWGDECFVVANLIERGYGGLLRPLDYQQAAPILFLWAELTVVKILGLSECTVRLVPTACAIAGLFAFRHLASRLMKGLPLLMGVAIVAVALNPVRHGGEAKPYASDFFASAALLAMAVEWWRRPGHPAWLWALAGVTPLAMGLSLPSIFVLGGISLAMAWPVMRARTTKVTAAYLAFNAALLASFVASLALYRDVQSGETKAYMDHYWSGLFPPLDRPGRLAFWLIRAHTGQLFAYPVGGANGGSLLTVIAAILGSADLCRRGRGMIAVACVAPLGLALVASTIRIYPYGESERLMQFEGPMICLLAGHGLAWSLGRLRHPGWYRRGSVACLVGLGAIGFGAIVADVVRPAKSVEDLRAREFARWFWAEAGRDAELACARVDLGLDFEGGPTHSGRSADYLSYQAIFSSRHRQGRPLDWARVSATRPLRCVLYDGVPADSTLFAGWMDRMNRHYRLTRAETYRVNAGVAPRGVSSEDHFAVLDFVPKAGPIDPAGLAREAIDAESRSGRGSLSLPGPR